MTKLLTTLTILLIATASYAQVNLEVLTPLAVGNYWKYKEVEGDRVQESIILESKDVGGITWYLSDGVIDSWVYNGKEGLYEVFVTADERILPKEHFEIYRMYNSYNKDREEEILFREYFGKFLVYKYPVENIEEYDTRFGKMIPNKLSESMEVSAGKFSNIIEYKNLTPVDGEYITSWFAAGVGLIKIEYKYDEFHVTYELIEYKIK